MTRTLTELFQLGMFENPYADPAKAVATVATPADWDHAAQVHRQSVVLLKNDNTLPLTADKLAGKKIYAEAFFKRPEASEASTKALHEMLRDVTLTDDPAQADYAILLISPSSGEYFNATPGYLELSICEDKTVPNVDADGVCISPNDVPGYDKDQYIADALKDENGKAYAYRDSAGNYYELNFGLTCE